MIAPTLGLEAEYWVEDARTGELRPEGPGLAAALTPAEATTEMFACQLELRTPVCADLGELSAAWTDVAGRARAAAAERGLVLRQWGVHPGAADPHELSLSPGAYYAQVRQESGAALAGHATCGIHVHAGNGSTREASTHRIVHAARWTLPALAAWSAPHGSARAQVRRNLPRAGLPPPCADRESYETIRAALGTGHSVWWDARPNTSHSTAELRNLDPGPLLGPLLGCAAVWQAIAHDPGAVEDADPLRCKRAGPVASEAVLAQRHWEAAVHGLNAPGVRRLARRVLEAVEHTVSWLGTAPWTRPLERQLQYHEEHAG